MIKSRNDSETDAARSIKDLQQQFASAEGEIRPLESPAIRLSRRRFIEVAGLTTIGGVFGVRTLAGSSTADCGQAVLMDLAPKEVIRADDLLRLTFVFDNLILKCPFGEHPPRLVRKVRTKAASITVVFQPQHLAEESFDASVGVPVSNPPNLSHPAKTWLSNESWLKFGCNSDQALDWDSGIDYDFRTLLSFCSKNAMVVAPNALGYACTGSSVPNNLAQDDYKRFTAIEAPFRLILSPSVDAAWIHSTTAVSHDGTNGVRWVELWHTRLATRDDAGIPSENLYPNPSPGQSLNKILRAVWTRDADTPRPTTVPIDRAPMDERDRREIVRLTSDFQQLPGTCERVIAADQLMLSSLGAWMKVQYLHEPPPRHPELSLTEWKHQMTTGRDQYVKTVHRGYLYPFGHPASFIQIRKRVLYDGATPGTAFLEKRYYIILKEHLKVYADAAVAKGGRDMFKDLNILDDNVIEIDAPNAIPGIIDPKYAFWITVNGAPFRFKCQTEDYSGTRHSLSVAAIFVGSQILVPQDLTVSPDGVPPLDHVRRGFYDSAHSRDRIAEMNGQSVTFVPPSHDVGVRDIGSLDTARVTFGVRDYVDSPDANGTFVKKHVETTLEDGTQYSWFYPTVNSAEVTLSLVDVFRETHTPCIVTFNEAYIDQGFPDSVPQSNNVGEVFFDLVDPVRLDFQTDATRTGGFLLPNLNVISLSRVIGLVGGGTDVATRANVLKNFAAGTFIPFEIFDDASLLGDFSLRYLLDRLSNFQQSDFENGRSTPPQFSLIRTDETIEARLCWRPKFSQFVLNSDGTPSAKPSPLFGKNLEIDAIRRVSRSGAIAQSQVECMLHDYKLSVASMQITLAQVSFSSNTAASDTGVMRLHDPSRPTVPACTVAFENALIFLGDLATLFGKLLGTTLVAKTFARGIELTYTVGRVPEVNLGFFALHNLAPKLDVVMGFGKAPVFTFSFAEQNDPFSIRFLSFQGNGYFQIKTVGSCPEPLYLAIGLRFGASLNLGFAALSANGGIDYFSHGSNVELSGYLSCSGSANVLNLVSVSINFAVALYFRSDPPSVSGATTVYIDIHVLFVDVTVPLDFSFDFQWIHQRLTSLRSSSFKDGMTKKDWDVYCDAFA